ncbi:MAG TPA: sugar phosphate isomerase/epimerase [Armatimonadota bacterium]|nr:sugar phosphate isomerase/epimerase [Armatimonadota bacterium]
MKIGVFTALFGQQPLEQALDYIAASGVEAVEIGTGNYPGNPHCDAKALLASAPKRKEFLKAIESRGLILSGLSCHGNPLHPSKRIAKEHHDVHRLTVQLAAKLGVERVIGFSGCPGDGERAKAPNWVTCPWPPDFTEVVEWQWKEKVVPYWKAEAAYARKHGIKLCFEMHPGFVVYNPETMLRLRDACGDNVGANFDPSHLFWQGIDPTAAIRMLKDCIFHVHAKDARIDAWNTRVNGVLDTKGYGREADRSWIFRTVGYGHSYEVWKDIVSHLRMVGYDYVLSIEHEDSLMSVNEGFQKAVTFLKQVVISESPTAMWWA